MPEFKLLYECGYDEFNPEKFHENCDEKGPTLLIFETTNSMRYCGYTEK